MKKKKINMKINLTRLMMDQLIMIIKMNIAQFQNIVVKVTPKQEGVILLNRNYKTKQKEDLNLIHIMLT